jgi:hypothetical protein
MRPLAQFIQFFGMFRVSLPLHHCDPADLPSQSARLQGIIEVPIPRCLKFPRLTVLVLPKSLQLRATT